MLNKFLLVRKLAIIIFVAAILTTAIIYLQSDIQQRADKIHSFLARFAENSRDISQLADMESKAEQAKQYNQLMSRYFITKDNLLTFPGDINSLAQRNNLSANVSFGEEAASPGSLRRTNVNLSFSGNAQLKDLANFLSALEQSRYFVKIQRFDSIFQGASASGNFSGQIFSF